MMIRPSLRQSLPRFYILLLLLLLILYIHVTKLLYKNQSKSGIQDQSSSQGNDNSNNEDVYSTEKVCHSYYKSILTPKKESKV